MRIDVLSVFPEYLEPLRLSIIGKAIGSGLIDLSVTDLRDFTHDVHRTVDDSPFGGGPGMVMKPEPWGEAVDAVLGSVLADDLPEPAGGSAATDESATPVTTAGSRSVADPVIIVPSASGRLFNQSLAQDLSGEAHLVFACARYEGIDGRVMEHYGQRVRVLEVSIGDYVLAGGEPAALVMIEAIARLIPGVLGNAESVADDSFSPGRVSSALEGPVYTRPRQWRELQVPPVLLSGDHEKIRDWRARQSTARTQSHRPDLV